MAIWARRTCFIGAMALAVAFCGLASAQRTNPVKFEVATVKPMEPNGQIHMGIEVRPGGRVNISGFSLKALICTAFGVSYWQLSGGEDWTEKVLYTVDALPPEDVRASRPDTRHSLFTIGDERLRRMLQALLVERFQLKYHRETKTGNVFLMRRNAGVPLRLQETVAPESAGSLGWAEHWRLRNTTMGQLAKFASDFNFHRPVLDETELAGGFDYKGPPEEPEIYNANPTGSFLNLLRQVGLTLDAAKGPVETFVIEQALRPTGN